MSIVKYAATASQPIATTKVIVYSVSAAMAGIGGALFATASGSIEAVRTFTLDMSIPIVLLMAIGGMAYPIAAIFTTFQVALTALGERQQLAYRAVNRHPEWHVQLQQLVDAVAADPMGFQLAARAAQTAHAANRPPGEPVTTLPAWTIVEPLPVDELLGYYREAEEVTGVPWQYLAAIHFQETRMGRVVGVSSAGAVGPMQFLPSTWAACCEGDATVARDAIIGAAHYLVASGGPADMQAALYGYNPNDGYVGAVTAYAQAMIADERAYLGYHGWQVFYSTSEGTVRLPVGYTAAAEVDVLGYVREHPEDVLPAV